MTDSEIISYLKTQYHWTKRPELKQIMERFEELKRKAENE